MGGEGRSCLEMLDAIQYINSDLVTLGFGSCHGMASFILAMGQKNKRFSLRNTSLIINHPTGVARGQATDIYREAKELLKIRERINTYIAEQTNQPLDKVAFDLRRNLFMTPEDAIEYGLIDAILLRNTKHTN